MNTLSILYTSYLSYMKYQKKYSKHTLRAYEFELMAFDEFLQEQSLSWENLCAKDISSWLIYLHKQTLSPRSISRNLSVLRVFFDYLLNKQNIQSNPFILFNAPKSQKKIPTTLTPKEMLYLLENMPTKTVLERRNKCLLFVMYTTGIRAEEICYLPLNKVFIQQKLIRILGKGNKERIMPLIPLAIDYLTQWIEERKLLFRNLDDTLFLSKNGKALTTDMVRKIVYKSSLFLQKKIHPHAFRYTFATHLLDNDANLRYIQELLGHANLSVTQRYTKVSITHLKQKFKQTHPRA